MKHRTSRPSTSGLTALLILAALAVPAAGAAEPPEREDFVGVWQGTLDAGAVGLRLVFHLDSAADGELEATLDSPDQGATGIPVAAVVVEGAAIEIEVRVLGAEFAGRLTGERQAIEGEWRQSGHVIPLRVERVEEVAEEKGTP